MVFSILTGTTAFLEEWVRWDDERLNGMICSAHTPDGYAKEIFLALRERRLFKCIFSENLNGFNAVVRREIAQNFDNYRKKLEQKVGDYLGIDRFKVIANPFKIQSVRTQSRNDEEPIMVATAFGAPKSFEDVSTLFRSINEAEKDEYLDIYAPVIFIDDREKRQKMGKYFRDIHGIIEGIVNPGEQKE